MTDKDFDGKIKGLADIHEEPVDAEIWKGIEDALARKGRWSVVRRVSYIAAAAAAIVAGVFFTMEPFSEGIDNMVAIAVEEVEADAEKGGISAGEVEVPVEKTDVAQGLEVVQVREARLTAKAEKIPVKKQEVQISDDGQKVSVSEADVPEKESETIAQRDGEAANESKKPEKEYKTISEQIADNGYLALNEDHGKKTRLASVSASGNLYTLNSSGNVDFSRPGFSAGGGTGANYGIVPLTNPEHYFPVSVGLQLQFSFLQQKMGLGVGVNYTYLYSRYEALVNRTSQGDVHQSLHYIGVPVNLYFNILNSDKLVFYANLGGMVEKGLNAKYKITDLYDNTTVQKESISGLQWSANVGLGFECRFIKAMGIYIDPRLTYFFDCKQPYSIRTEQPLQFNLEVGFRFHL